MKYAYWGLALIMAGLVGIVFMVMFQSITINNETEYYILKEAMEAAMMESVDIECYRSTAGTGCGEVLKISEQKFVENFTRRFVENITGDVNSYELEFYDIIESPPKASVIVKGLTQEYSIMATGDSNGSFKITNNLSGILEYEPLDLTNEGGITIVTNQNSALDMNVNTNSQEVQDYDPDTGVKSEEDKEIESGEETDFDNDANKNETQTDENVNIDGEEEAPPLEEITEDTTNEEDTSSEE